MMTLDKSVTCSRIPPPRWSDAHRDQRRKGQHADNASTWLHQRKSAFETAQPGRRPELSCCPGRLKWAFSFWETIHFLIDKSGGVLSRDIETTGARPSQPNRPRGESHRRRINQDALENSTAVRKGECRGHRRAALARHRKDTTAEYATNGNLIGSVTPKQITDVPSYRYICVPISPPAIAYLVHN